jgi:hypothetical protein
LHRTAGDRSDTLERVNLEVDPEPTPQERAALVSALRRLVGEPVRADPGPWWRQGVREAVEEEAERADSR